MRGVNRWLIGSSLRLPIRRTGERIVRKTQRRLRPSMAQMAEGVLSVVLNMAVRVGMHWCSGGVDRTTILSRRARPRPRRRDLVLDLAVAEGVLLSHRLRRLRAVGAGRVYTGLSRTEATTTT